MENRWIKAATILQPTIEVCGKRLLPFCLRHRVALEAIDSPLLNLEKTVSPAELIASIRILSTHNIENVRKPASWSEIWWSFRLSRNRQLLIDECYKLSVYMMEQSLWPRFWVNEESESKSSSVPRQLTMVASLMRNGCTLEQAWTMPESEAVWLHIAHCSAAGSKIQIVSDVEWKAMETYKKKQGESKQKPVSRMNTEPSNN